MLAIASRQTLPRDPLFLFTVVKRQLMAFDKAFWLRWLHLSIYLPLTMARRFLTEYQTFQNQLLEVQSDACCAEHGRQHVFFYS